MIFKFNEFYEVNKGQGAEKNLSALSALACPVGSANRTEVVQQTNKLTTSPIKRDACGS